MKIETNFALPVAWKYLERGQIRYALNKPKNVESEKVTFDEMMEKMKRMNKTINEAR